jgi:hypothetical protein
MARRPVSDPDVAIDGANSVQENSLVEGARRLLRGTVVLENRLGPVLRPLARLQPLAGRVRFNRVLPIIAETLLLTASCGHHIIIVPR